MFNTKAILHDADMDAIATPGGLYTLSALNWWVFYHQDDMDGI
jgi:hypothetical protein